MAKQIKKYGKKALIFGLILVLVAMYVTIPSAQATTYLTKESDTLSDSRPTILANHDIKFLMTATIAEDETVTVKFNDYTSGGTITVIGDWDISSDEDGDGEYDNPLTPTTHWTFTSAAIDTADPVYTFTFTSAGATAIGSDKYIQIEFTNGTDKLPNPAVGSKKIDIAGTFGPDEIGVIYVYIIAGVTVSATVSESLTFARVGLAAAACLNDTGTIDSTINTSGDADTVPFGTLGSNFTVACQELTVTTNAANGYVVTEQEDDQLKFNGTTFADCVCDASACPDANSNAAVWTDTSTVSGFGHGCEKSSGDGVVCAAAYDVWGVGKYYYRQFASIADADTAQTLMSYTTGAPTIDHVAIIHYKIKKSGTQAAGTYQNAIVYIATPTY